MAKLSEEQIKELIAPRTWRLPFERRWRSS